MVESVSQIVCVVSEETDILGKRLKVYGGGCGLWHGRMNAMIT